LKADMVFVGERWRDAVPGGLQSNLNHHINDPFKTRSLGPVVTTNGGQHEHWLSIYV